MISHPPFIMYQITNFNVFRSSLTDELLEKCAKESGFRRRKSKITPQHIHWYVAILRFIEYWEMLIVSNGGFLVWDFWSLCFEAIDRWAVQCIGPIFCKVNLVAFGCQLHIYSSEKSYLSHFDRVRIKDSTKFILSDFLKEYYWGTGGNVNTSKACISIQFEYDIKSSSIVELVLTDGNRNDITDVKESLDCIGAGDLIIRDLGYCSLTVLEGIKQRKVFFIYRLMSSLSVFDFYGEDINFKRICEKMRRYSIPYLEMIIYIGNKERIMMRLY